MTTDKPPTQDHDVLSAEALAPGETVGVKAGRWQVLLLRTDDGEFHALNDRCPHAASRLSTGRMRKDRVMCPLHGARFDAATGKCVGGPYPTLRTFPLRVESGRVIVSVPVRPPDLSETPLF